MLPCYVLLDLETTGGNPVNDRITEIAAVRVEQGVEVARWSTLVNPGVYVSGFIERLTGISNAMVSKAPRFSEVASELLALLDGAVLVAHNVRFDHGFLLNEFSRMDVALRVNTLCTVRLSRLLYPQFKSHGLDAIMQRHGLTSTARHRAMGDVDVMQSWLMLAQAELGMESINGHAQRLLQGSAALPPQLDTKVSDIPDTPGIYIFYGEGSLPLYIGKSVKLRSRVMSHFQTANRNAREMRIAQEIRHIEWIETAGELGALLLETRLVKEQQPIHNRQRRQQLALTDDKLQVWPFAGKVGLREHNPRTGRTDIHLFDQWSHLATVHSDEKLHEALHSRSEPLAFNLDTYSLVIKHLLVRGKSQLKILEFNSDSGEPPAQA